MYTTRVVDNMYSVSIEFQYKSTTVETRFNEVAGDRPNLFVKWRVRYKPRYNEFEGKRPEWSLCRSRS